MAKTRVMVEISPESGLPIRIFKYPTAALFHAPEVVREWSKKDAIASIRHQIWLRTAGKCEYCGAGISENGYRDAMEMHEEIPRGSVHVTGEVSLANSKGICQKCHRNHPKGHANRKLHFGEPTNARNS